MSTIDNNDLAEMFAGTESLEDRQVAQVYRDWVSRMDTDMFAEQMGRGGRPSDQEERPMIRTNDHKHYRIYVSSTTCFTSNYINLLCRFLDSRKIDEEVTFILGAKLDDCQAHMLGPIISAISSCAATTRAIAAGYCSIAETMIWCFVKERVMYRYGALTVGITDITKVCPKYQSYYDVFLSRAVLCKLITVEERKEIWTSRRGKFIMYQDYMQQQSEAS